MNKLKFTYITYMFYKAHNDKKNPKVQFIKLEFGIFLFEVLKYYFTSLIVVLSIQPSVPSVNSIFFH